MGMIGLKDKKPKMPRDVSDAAFRLINALDKAEEF